MKKILKKLALAGFTAVVCLIWVLPADAQRGGGGHTGGGGGGGGGHFGGGGGFSGGHVGGGFSGSRPISSPQRFNGAARGSFAPRSGFNTGSRSGFRGNSPAANGGHGYAGYGRGAYNHGVNAHNGYGRGGYGRGDGDRPYGWGRHDGYFYCHGYYGSLYYPYLGLDFGYLPYDCYPFDWGGEEYYFGNGLYYQAGVDDQYTVVEPPIGATVNSLPSDAQSIIIDGQQYYELNGVYYSPVTKDDGKIEYEITGKDGVLNTDAAGTQTVVPKVGNIVTALPSDCKKVNLNGQSFFVSEDGIYYQEIKDGNGNKAYKIVGLESEQAGN